MSSIRAQRRPRPNAIGTSLRTRLLLGLAVVLGASAAALLGAEGADAATGCALPLRIPFLNLNLCLFPTP